MPMHKILTVLAIILLVGAGCEPAKPIEPIITPMSVPEPDVLLELPNPGETKAVTFMIDVGQTGGMGSMPVVTETGVPFFVNGIPVYADALYEEVSKKMPECFVGRPKIVVRATVSLEERRDINPSIPPGPVPAEESYYLLVIHNLDSIVVEAEPCTE